jgi:hypothetical protein
MAKALKNVGEVVGVVKPQIALSQEHINRLVDLARDSKSHSADLLFSLMKWLFSSLLAINGAAAIAVLGYEKLGSAYLIWAEVAFVLGIILALLAVLFAMFYFLRFLPDIGAILMLKPGSYDVDYIDKITSGEEAQEPWKDPVVLIGFMPISCFLAGVILVTSGS